MPYLGEITMFAGPFTPEGWKICAGQEMSVQHNQALYSIIGNQYGGDNRVFYLPDLRDRFPVQPATKYQVGKQGGATQYKIAPENLPTQVHTVNDPGHKHVVDLSSAPHTSAFAVPTVPGEASRATTTAGTTGTGKSGMTVTQVPLTITPPSLSINFIICVEGGDYPPRSDD
ncbi:Microcystin-dependent protein [Granulicella pectinivorans]|uniref:Microcystin-dependent protein n=1 Tax=Granulicella pectinivorans TaxID=474950 RepID=A0A1I6MTH2_9BACT|nr:tail fiber protein [Granulicella pectinivorans]SFS18937.1 Microcystin-dependent protein [Granulicella pectinivorans]